MGTELYVRTLTVLVSMVSEMSGDQDLEVNVPDMRSEAEKEEAKKMIEDVAKIKADTFDYLRYFVRGDFDLKTSGYTTLEQATNDIMKRAMNKIAKREFLKKFPD